MQQETIRLGGGVYTAPDIATVLGIPKHKVNYWVSEYLKGRIKSERGFQYHETFGRHSVFGFHSLIEVFTFFHLKEKGVKTKAIIEAHEVLAKRYKTHYPFAHADILRAGGEVIFSELDKDGKELFIGATSSLQLKLKLSETFDAFSTKLRFSANKLAEEFRPLGPNSAVVVSPDHQFGQPTIEGTNILVDTIGELAAAGESRSRIKKIYQLSDRQVNDAITYFRRAA